MLTLSVLHRKKEVRASVVMGADRWVDLPHWRIEKNEEASIVSGNGVSCNAS